MKHSMAYIILACAAVVVIAAYFLFFRSMPLLGSRKTEIAVGGNKFSVEVVSTVAASTRGLSGREKLGDGEGMLFVFPSAWSYPFWMKDMKFAIDFVWIHGNVVVGTTENAVPEPGKGILSLKIYYPPAPVDRVLEMNAGAVAKYNIRAGDHILLPAI